jgi:hypothetical protein
MSVYAVYEPPLRAYEPFSDPMGFAFVRDGFYFLAFLLTPFWMIWHRLWLSLVIYLIGSALLETVLRQAGASVFATGFVAVLISLLIGLEGATLRRWSLRRRGYREAGFVRGDGLADAERRFFAAWTSRPQPDKPDRPRSDKMQQARSSAATAPPPARAEPSGIIGLFPEPGAPR